MGVVWKALDTKLDREVALKFLPADFAQVPERLAHRRVPRIDGVERAVSGRARCRSRREQNADNAR